jgi:serine/threonine-protein kinase
MADDLPVLIASLTPDLAEMVNDAAMLGQSVRIQLKWAPVEAGPHLLEVYLPTSTQPLNFLCEPLEVGDGGEDKTVPLRVYPWEEDDSAPVSSVMPEIEVPQLPSFVGRQFARGRFEIISQLGEGSIGAVYKARHTGLGILVALKVLHEAFQHDREFGRRFHDEALALSHLDHPNLIHIQDFGQDPDEELLYISMAFVEGDTVRALQKKIPNKVFDLPRMVNLMAQACAGLGHAHDRGLIHRDVKPDNMMVLTREDDDGKKAEIVKVLDFGFAVPPKVSGEVAQRLAGTPVYMSPEQCLGQELDGRSDLYAIGIMLFEMATGTVPFIARDAESIRKMHVRQPAPLISSVRPDVDPRLDRVVAKALSKRREDRQASLTELRADLRALLMKPAVPIVRKKNADGAPSSSRLGAAAAANKAPPAPPRPAPATPATPASPKPPSAEESPAWWSAIANETSLPHVAQKLSDLGPQALGYAQAGDVVSLKLVVSLLEKIAKRVAGDEEAENAHQTLDALLRDAMVLTPVATRLLAHDEEGRRPASELLVRAGQAGVYALYGARTKVAADQEARIAFVTTMKAFGADALTVVRAALEKVFTQAVHGDHRAAVELAEDLLLSVPSQLDDPTGRLVEQYAGSRAPNLCRAAARALPRVWADRAAPTLVKLLDHEDDGVLTATLIGFRDINAVDFRVVRKIGSLADRKRLRTPQLRQAAMAALSAAMPSAKPDADAIIEQLRKLG